MRKKDVKKTTGPISLYGRYVRMNRDEQKVFKTFCLNEIKITNKTFYNWISGKSVPCVDIIIKVTQVLSSKVTHPS
jgi:hypothetical protein